jgi:hypothetical protein
MFTSTSSTLADKEPMNTDTAIPHRPKILVAIPEDTSSRGAANSSIAQALLRFEDSDSDSDSDNDDATPTNPSGLDAAAAAVAAAGPSSQEKQDDTPPSKAPRQPAQAYDIGGPNIYEGSRMHFISSELKDGDTLVFIDYPDCPRDYKSQADCYGMNYRSQQFRVSSAKLLATESSKFAEMLGPTYQFRIKRRRRMVNSMPEGVKFLLDLTPPSEGDELVFQMTELSLTPGLTKWWTSYSIHSTDATLVAGHDDVCSCAVPTHAHLPHPDIPYQLDMPPSSASEPVASASSEPSDPETNGEQAELDGAQDPPPYTTGRVIKHGARINAEMLLILKARKQSTVYEIPPYRQVPDYCPIRHRNCIIRLLLLIHGHHVMLDSATRVWTLVGVAKILDCSMVIRDDIAQWIMHGYNVRFIEILPEEALQLGHDLQLVQVTQCAYRILVNELALEEAADGTSRTQPGPVTIFGRRRSPLGDELSNLIQHAARAFVERLNQDIRGMKNDDFLDLFHNPEWQKLRSLKWALVQDESQGVQAASSVLTALETLMDSLRWLLLGALETMAKREINARQPQYASMDLDRATYVEPRDFEEVEMIWRNLNLTQRFLCSMGYHQFSDELDNTSSFSSIFRMFGAPNLGELEAQFKMTETALETYVSSRSLHMGGSHWKTCIGSTIYVPSIVTKVRSRLCNLPQLSNDIRARLKPFLNSWLRHEVELPMNITRHLVLTLNQDEMKFLPLWAGGCDDGSGGVFEPTVPHTDMGPNGPGPAYHTGFTIPSAPSSSTGTMVEDLGGMRIMGSTTAGSVDVHDSISTVYRPDEVIADDVSIESEAFTMASADYQDARFEIPANGQATSRALREVCEMSTDGESAIIGRGDDEMTIDGDWSDGNGEEKNEQGAGSAKAPKKQADGMVVDTDRTKGNNNVEGDDSEDWEAEFESDEDMEFI